MPIQMTRAEYEAKYGGATSAPKKAPVQMTRAQFESKYGSKPTEQPQEDGIIKSLVRPFGRLTVNAIKAGQMIAGQDVDKTAPINLPYLGATKPVGQEGTPWQKLKESLGVAGEVASTVTPMGRAVPIVKTGLKGLIAQGAKEGAITGALSGSIYGAGKELQDPNATISSVAGQTLAGGGIGALGGSVLGGALPAVIKPIQSAKNIISKDVQTLRTEKVAKGLEAQNTRLKTVEKAFNKNTTVRKLPDGTKETITPVQTFGKYNIAPDVEKGTISMGDYRTGVGQLGKIKENVETIDDAIDSVLKETGNVSLVQLRAKAIQAAKSNAELREAGKVQTTIKKINTVFDDFRRSYGGRIPISEINNIRKTANRDYNQETFDVSRILGNVARDIVHNSTKDQSVKKLLQEQGLLLSAKDYAEKLNGTKVIGGRLGNHALRLAGAMIGSTVDKLPILGPLVGMLGGEFAARGLQKAQFKSLPVEIKALLQSSKSTIPTQSAKTIPARTNMPQTIQQLNNKRKPLDLRTPLNKK